MVKKRITRPEDIRRLAEGLLRFSRGRIKDKSTFDAYWKGYMPEDDRTKDALKEDAYNHLKSKGVIKEKDLFTKAGGKDFAKDRKRRARKVVRSQKQYIKAGAQNVDLEGYDMPQRREFTGIGRIKKRIVYVYRQEITVRGKKAVRYRDSKGRFASGKVKKT